VVLEFATISRRVNAPEVTVADSPMKEAEETAVVAMVVAEVAFAVTSEGAHATEVIAADFLMTINKAAHLVVKSPLLHFAISQ